MGSDGDGGAGVAVAVTAGTLGRFGAAEAAGSLTTFRAPLLAQLNATAPLAAITSTLAPCHTAQH